LRQLANLVGHDSKAAAVLACPRRLERQKVSLVGDIVNRFHNLANFRGEVFEVSMVACAAWADAALRQAIVEAAP
jgi:hypothetical protein